MVKQSEAAEGQSLYEVRFAEQFKAEAGRYDSLVRDAVAQGCERIAANPARALSGFTIEITDAARQMIFEVAFRRLGRLDPSPRQSATVRAKSMACGQA